MGKTREDIRHEEWTYNFNIKNMFHLNNDCIKKLA